MDSSSDRTLEALLADRRPPEIPRGIAILRDVAAVLDAAHRGGIVYGNVAPARVLIDAAGHATISNLGLPPSPLYRAPEQWRGEGVGPLTDQYALAVMAFQMLTGQPPFEGVETDLMRLHLSAAVPRAAALRKGVTPAMDAALRRAMGKVPELRFSTAGAFVDALSGDRPIAISLDSIEAIRHAEHPSAGRIGLAMGAVVVAALGIAAIAIGTHRAPQAPPVGSPEPPAPVVRDSAPAAPQPETAAVTPPAQPPASPAPSPTSTPTPVPASAPVPNGAPPEAVPPDLAIAPPSRPAPSAGGGAFIRVVVRGGVAAIRIDGRTYGFSPAVVSVAPGTHVVTVDGAGDAFLPSQRVVEASARDTIAAVFTPRIQHDAGVPDSNAAPLDTARR